MTVFCLGELFEGDQGDEVGVVDFDGGEDGAVFFEGVVDGEEGLSEAVEAFVAADGDVPAFHDSVPRAPLAGNRWTWKWYRVTSGLPF